MPSAEQPEILVGAGAVSELMTIIDIDKKYKAYQGQGNRNPFRIALRLLH
jgi:hypothetical protein